MNRKFLIFLLAGILLGIACSQMYKSSDKTESADTTKISADTSQVIEVTQQDLDSVVEGVVQPSSEQQTDMTVAVSKTQIPAKVYTVLKYVDTYHKPMENYVGGTKFGNYESKLPKVTAKKININYLEWDVNPKVKSVNRGAERLVTGDDKSAWYTSDHYSNFTKIR